LGAPPAGSGVDDLARAVREARRLAAAANALLKLRLSPPSVRAERLSAAAIELLLLLSSVGGSAPVTLLAERVGASTREVLATLREMEELGLVKVFETPTRAGALLSPEGWRLALELARAFGLK